MKGSLNSGYWRRDSGGCDLSRLPQRWLGPCASSILARGNQGRPIFADDRDRQLWLETLEEVCGKTGWRIHAFVSWVADRLEMGHPGRVSQAVTRMRIRPGRRLRQFQRVLYRLEK